MSLAGIGIIGGVGPEAGTLLHRYVIEETANVGVSCDQDHRRVYHLSDSPSITDRTKFLKGEVDENPAEGAFKVGKILDDIGFAVGRLVVGVPCNTFHSPKIWGRFMDLVRDGGLKNIEILNMIEETGRMIKEAYPDLETVGLMSTTGTRETRIYHEMLEAMGLSVVETDSQDELHQTIYDPEFGIKAVSPVSDRAVKNFEGFARELKEKGAEVIIQGCTEIPIAFGGASEFEDVPLVDPMRALAKAMVERVD